MKLEVQVTAECPILHTVSLGLSFPSDSDSAPESGPFEWSIGVPSLPVLASWPPHLKLLCSEHIGPGLGQHLLTKPGLSVDVHWAQCLAGQELMVDVVGLLS